MNESGMTSHEIWNSILNQTPTSMPIMYSNGYTPTNSDGDINPWVASTQCGYNEQWWNNIQTNITLNQKLDFITKGLNLTQITIILSSVINVRLYGVRIALEKMMVLSILRESGQNKK